MRSHLCVLLAGAATVLAQTQYTSTGTAAVAKARATALTESPTSNVVGNSFNRFVTIWCENTDYSMAAGDRTYSSLPTSSSLYKFRMRFELEERKADLSSLQQISHTWLLEVFYSPTTSPLPTHPNQTMSPL
jgi:hypothetical protein